MPIQETKILIPSAGMQLDGFLARPMAKGNLPAILVIHEIGGLNDNLRSICRRFASEGYVALAPDLFTGGVKALCVVRTLTSVFSSETDNYATRHLKNALDYLCMQSYVDKKRLGAIGFCMGGNFALAIANEDRRVKTIAPFYATTPRKLNSDVGRLCPVVASYPRKDFTASQGIKLEAALSSAGIDHDFKIYPKAKHSFMNEGSSTYNAEAAQDAWTRTLAYFKDHI